MSVKWMPVGYRFHPTDQELVNHYLRLKNKQGGSEGDVSNIPEIDVCKWEPWELPGLLSSGSDDQEWYFFGRRDSKYGKSTRSNRATKHGYWKPTGKDRYIKTTSKKLIGTKKTLVFYQGRAQKAVRTPWVMHEYRASADKHNPQAFVLYLLKNKSDENLEIPNSDEPHPNNSWLINNVPSYSPSTPTVLQGSGNFSSSDHARVNQNWKEQEVSSDAPNYPFDSSTFLQDDIDLQVFESCFDGQQPTWEGLNRILPAIPLADVYPNQGPVHMTARYINVSSNDHRVTQFQHSKGRQDAVSNIDDVSSIFLANSVTPDAESGTETDNDVPQSLFDEDAVYAGSAYLSDSESSNPELYDDMILAHEVSLSAKNCGHVELEADESKKPISSGRVCGSANNPRMWTNSEVPAQASSKKEYSDVPPKKLESKIVEAVGDDNSIVGSLIPAKSISLLEVTINESSGDLEFLGRKSRGIGFMLYAENPRVKNGITPPSNYIMNLVIGIFLTVVIMGEVLFGLVT